MDPITVTFAPEIARVRMLATSSSGELVRAVLGPARAAHPRAAATLLEGLALWHQRSLSVVVYVDGSDDGSALGLYDALGFGSRSLHYDVTIATRADRRHRPPTLGGRADFRDLHAIAHGAGGSR